MWPSYLLPAAAAAASLSGLAAGLFIARRNPTSRPVVTFVSDLLPWNGWDEDGTTLRIGRLGRARVVHLRGLTYDGLNPDRTANFMRQRHAWLRDTAQMPVRARFLTLRRPVAVPPPVARSGFLGDLDAAWYNVTKNAYQTDHYVILSVKTDGQLTRLTNAVDTLFARCSEYKPDLMRVIDPEDPAAPSPLLSFLATLLNGRPIRIAAPPNNAPLPVCSIQFPADVAQPATLSDGFRTQHIAVLGVRAHGEHTDPGLVRAILSTPGALELHLNTEAIDPTKASTLVKWRAKQAQSTSFNALTAAEWEATKDELGAGEQVLIDTEMSVVVTADTRDALEEQVDAVIRAVGSKGTRLVRETLLAERLWWSRLPGFDYWTRKRTLRSANVADLLLWSAEPRGLDRCDWGAQPVRYVPTAAGRTPYGLTFHVEPGPKAPAHWGVLAPTGSGKTTVAAFLATGALSAYPDLRVFAFDYNFGLTVLARAIGGEYLIPGSRDLPLNPFDAPDTPDSRVRLERLLSVLAELDDDDAQKEIAHGVQAIMQAPRQGRTLKAHWDLAFTTGGPVKKNLRKWVQGTRYGQIFNGATDAFDPEASRFIGIALDVAKDDPRLAAALTAYFTDRIQAAIAATETPHLVFMDEAGVNQEIAAFAKLLETYLRTSRRARGSIGLAYQEMAAVLNSPIASTIESNVKTWFIWPGTARTAEECARFKLSEQGTAVALGQADLPRHAVLMKRDQEEILLDFNLASTKPLLRVFSGGPAAVSEMQKCYEKHGENWLASYIGAASPRA